MFRVVAQTIGIFLLVQMVANQFFGANKKGASPSDSIATGPIPAYDARPEGVDRLNNYNPIPQSIAPIWPMNSTLDLSMYISSSMLMPSLKSVDPSTKLVEEKAFTLGNWTDSRDIETSFAVPREVQNNGTLWAHFYIALRGNELDPTARRYNAGKAYHFARPLNHVLPKRKVVKTKKLLGGSNETVEDIVDNTPTGPIFASYYHPNFTMSLIPDSGTQNYPSIHPAVRQSIQLESTGARDESGQNGWYYPILFVNSFWQLRSHMIELNSTVTELPLRITLNNLNNWKFSMYASVDDSMKQTQRQAASGTSMTGSDGSELEMFKSILIDTNPYLLATTAIVSILHMIFEMLAFKSDIVSSLFKHSILWYLIGYSRIGATRKTMSVSLSVLFWPMYSCRPLSSSTLSTTARVPRG